jgi:hypothetical protein
MRVPADFTPDGWVWGAFFLDLVNSNLSIFSCGFTYILYFYYRWKLNPQVWVQFGFCIGQIQVQSHFYFGRSRDDNKTYMFGSGSNFAPNKWWCGAIFSFHESAQRHQNKPDGWSVGRHKQAAWSVLGVCRWAPTHVKKLNRVVAGETMTPRSRWNDIRDGNISYALSGLCVLVFPH